MRSLAAEARAARHLAVLDESTVEFNFSGVAGASFSAIAKRLGLTRAGIYNYCSDRQDLVFQCYQRACALAEDDLLRACDTPARGAERLGVFLKLSVDLGHAPVSVLSELAFLNRRQQTVIREARAKNVQLLENILLQGQQDGSIRRCDLDVVCQAIFGVLSWAPLSRIWTRHDDAEFAARMAAAIPDMILNGVAASNAPLPETHRRIADGLIDVQRTEREQRLESLARIGSMLFNRRGIDGVSLDDVALEMGATKGVLYHYFKSKSEFVAFCYTRAFGIYERIMAVAESCCSTGLEATMAAIELDVEAQLADIYPLWLSTGIRGLPAKMQVQLLKRNQLLAARSVALARRGLADGSLRRFDLEPVKLAAPGSFTYLSTWLPQADQRRAGEIAREISRFLLLGLRSRLD